MGGGGTEMWRHNLNSHLPAFLLSLASDNSSRQAQAPVTFGGTVKQAAVQMVHGQPSAITVKGGQVIPVMIYQSKVGLTRWPNRLNRQFK